MACAYVSQNPSGYSLSRPVAKEVTLPFSTLGFQERWGFPVRVQILLLLQIKFKLLFNRGMLWMRIWAFLLALPLNMHEWYSVAHTPSSASKSLQDSKSLAMEFFGCSRVKYFPVRLAFRQFKAAMLAMRVSKFNLRCFEAGRLATTVGIPSGKSELLRGTGGFFTPGIGFSRAREKVQQFGPQCCRSET